MGTNLEKCLERMPSPEQKGWKCAPVDGKALLSACLTARLFIIQMITR